MLIPIADLNKLLYSLLESHLVSFLQEGISDPGRIEAIISQPLSIQKEFTQILKELGVFIYYVDKKKEENTNILLKWIYKFQKKTEFSERKLSNLLYIYRNKMYHFSNSIPYEFSVTTKIFRKMFNSDDFTLSFEEYYIAETLLNSEIQIYISAHFKHDNFLIKSATKVLDEHSSFFIETLHAEYAFKMNDTLKVQEMVNDEIIKINESLDSELRIASKQLGKHLLQKNIPKSNDKIQFGLWYAPLIDIGGDYYKITKISETEYSILIADIAGHGITAAIFFNTLKLTFEKFSDCYNYPGKLISSMNQDLFGKIGDFFITCLYVYINIEQKIIRYCNAGHPKGFVYSLKPEDTKRVKFLRQTGKVLGLFENTPYREIQINYDSQDRLVVYTDGIIETFNYSQVMLGERRLLQFFRNTTNLSAEETIRKVKLEILSFQGSPEKQDDRCIIITDLF